MKFFLLIIDNDKPDKLLNNNFHLLLQYKNVKDIELYLLTFCEDPLEKIPSYIRSIWPGSVSVFSAQQILKQVSSSARKNIVEFTALLRLRIKTIAERTVGSKWATYFEQNWWYTVLSERNTGYPVWWVVYRFYAIKNILSTNHFDKCIFIGSEALKTLTIQKCKQDDIPFDYKIIEQNTGKFPNNLQVPKYLIKRGVALICHLYSVILAKYYSPPQYPSHPSRNIFFAYSWFPRVWTHRDGQYHDMYYCNIINKCAKRKIKPIYIFRMYDKIEYLSPKTYRTRLKKHATTQFFHSNMIFESYIRIWHIVRTYLNILPIIFFSLTTMSRRFTNCFEWDEINYSHLLTLPLWYSIIQLWPSMEVLEKGAREINRHYRPNVTLLYSFEYIFGRAIVRGTRNARSGSVIVGMQHGVIAPNKLKFFAQPYEISKKGNNKHLLPEPDYFIFDGEAAKKIYATRGIEENRLLVLGPARFDSIWAKASNSTNRLRFSKMPITVLVAPGLHDADFMIAFAVKALASDIAVKIVIKPHPKLTRERIKHIINLLLPGQSLEEAGIHIVRTGDIYDWMQKADLMLVTYSSTGLEAVAFGLPIIILSSSRTPDRSPFYSDSSTVLIAASVKELRIHITQFIEDQSWRQQYMKKLQQDFHMGFWYL